MSRAYRIRISETLSREIHEDEETGSMTIRLKV